MSAGERLYELLPAHIRLKDEEVGEPLRALLAIVGETADALAADLARSYENLFIETSEDWVVPYLAELVGTTPLYDATRARDDGTARREFPDLRGPRLLPAVGASARADVARTIAMRRRKGTVAFIDDLARFATGWPVRVVEGLMRTGRTPHMRHVRPDLRLAQLPTRLESALVGRPFDSTTRWLDVRTPAGPVGWYHPSHVTVAVHRQRTQSHRRIVARPADQAWRFRLDPLGLDRELFTTDAPGSVPSAVPRALEAATVPSALHPALFEADLLAHVDAPRNASGSREPVTVLYGPVGEADGIPAATLGLWLDDVFVTPAQDEDAATDAYAARIVSRRLDPWPAARPPGGVVAVDVRNGRVAIGDGLPAPATLTASFHHGVAGSLGGGSYDRAAWLTAVAPSRLLTIAPAGADHQTVTAAIAAWTAAGGGQALIRILDSRRYDISPALDLGGAAVTIEAANGERPLLAPTSPDAVLTVTGKGSLTMSGVAVDGRLTIGQDVDRVRLLHSTLLPRGRRSATAQLVADGPSITVQGPCIGLDLQLAFSVCGGIRFEADVSELLLLDSIVGGGPGDAVEIVAGDGPDVRAERCTFLAPVRVRSITATACLFAGRLFARRTQEGCVRFCYVPLESRTPRRFACQPDRAVAEALEARPDLTAPERSALATEVRRRTRPVFVSRDYGDAGFAQLDPRCPAAISEGAEDGAEIGAYAHVKQPQRLDNLRRRLDEYLPAGIVAGIAVIT